MRNSGEGEPISRMGRRVDQEGFLEEVASNSHGEVDPKRVCAEEDSRKC